MTAVEPARPSWLPANLPGAGHYIQEDAPEEVAGALAAWWNSVVGASS